MNRNEEYAALRASIAEPPQLEYTVTRALQRNGKARRRVRLFGVPAGSLAACFLGFMLLVNLFPPFARACGGVPVLRELARAVSWSPSLSAAVEHDYVQPVGQEESKDGITARVEYLIVDQKQLEIFYSLDSDRYEELEADASIKLPDNKGGYGSSSGSYGTPNGELRQMTVNFMELDVPERLTLLLDVYQNTYKNDGTETKTDEESMDETYFAPHDREPDILTTFTFDLSIAPRFTAQGDIVEVERIFQIDDQTLILERAEIYPTHLRLDFGYAPENTAWLKGLEFYVENEQGERFDPVRNGLTASGEEASPSTVTYWMDSTYFSHSKELTLYITQVRWLDKDRERIWLNLATGEHGLLPDGAELAGIQRLDSGNLLTFRTRQYRENNMYSLWNGYLDENGEEQSFSSSGSSYTYQDPATGEYLDGSTSGVFYETVPLPAAVGPEVWLKPVFTRVADLPIPVKVPIR
ncbi:DUF4179 domain-containing protein [Oscillibacter sp.]|uniref:DUF4179 domain-containing protein n=1 Tax=Oscillibacter sp. TaxID=1945593 RepID=UPI002897DC7E|nr:DUF4179 domain-containing protein [Oscillibacter sp.]